MKAKFFGIPAFIIAAVAALYFLLRGNGKTVVVQSAGVSGSGVNPAATPVQVTPLITNAPYTGPSAGFQFTFNPPAPQNNNPVGDYLNWNQSPLSDASKTPPAGPTEDKCKSVCGCNGCGSKSRCDKRRNGKFEFPDGHGTDELATTPRGAFSQNTLRRFAENAANVSVGGPHVISMGIQYLATAKQAEESGDTEPASPFLTQPQFANYASVATE